MHIEQGVQDELIARAIEIAAAVQRAFGHRQLFTELGFIGRADLVDERGHVLVSAQHVGKHRQELVAVVSDLFVLDLEIQHAQKLAIGPGVGHQCLAALVAHNGGHRHPIVGMSSHDGVDATHPAGHLEVDVHAVVTEHHHHLRTLGTRLVHHLLHVLVLNAELPVGDHIARIGNGGVRERLTNDGARHPVDFSDDIGLEHRVAEVVGLDVLRDKVDLAGKVLFDDLFDTLHAERELPVTGHHIHTQELAGIDHVLTLGPQAGARTLPGVSAIQ